MASPAVVEFYVTCNPPLLPHGVGQVINLARAKFSFHFLVEILYEPEIPWFKCISFSEHQELVTAWIQDHLTKILEDETQPVDLDRDEEEDENGTDAQADIDIVVSNPQVIPWNWYTERKRDLRLTSFDPYRFPVPMASLPYKTVWRELEKHDQWTIQKFLQRVASIGIASQAPATIEQFEELTNCKLSHSLNGTVVYIGNTESMAVVNRVIEVLDTLLGSLHKQPFGGSHLILTPPGRHFEICYRWLSHLGLSQSTFVQASPRALPEEYRLLMAGAALRTRMRNSKAHLITDLTTYQFKGTLPAPAKGFSAFAGYKFPPKQPAAVNAAQASVTETTTPQDFFNPPSRPAPVAASRSFLGLPHSIANTASSSRARVANWVNRTGAQQRNSQSFPLEVGDCLISLEDTGPIFPNTGDSESHVSQGKLPDLLGSPEPSNDDFAQFDKSGDLIWLEESQNNPKPTTQRSRSDSLFQRSAAKENLNTRPDVSADTEGASHQPDRPGVPKAITNNDLDCLLDTPILLQASYNISGQESPGWAQSLSQRYPAIDPDSESTENKSGDSLALFGIRDEKPLEHFQTMRQRAGRYQRNRDSLKKDDSAQDNNETSDGKRGGRGAGRGRPFGRQTTPSKSPVKGDDVPGAVRSNKDATEWPSLPGKSTAPAPHPGMKLSYSAATMESLIPSYGNGRTSKPLQRFACLEHQAHGLNTAHPITALLPQTTQTPGLQMSESVVKGNTESSENGEADDLVFVDERKKTDLLKKVELRVKALAGILEVTQGNVSLELKFGRTYFTDIAHHVVSSGSGPSFPTEDFLDFLHDNSLMSPHRIKFSPVLSTIGADADALVNIQIPGEPDWKLSRTQTTYEFTCRLEGDADGPFIVDIDANTFDWQCKGLGIEISSLLLHCPREAWDMKVCAIRSASFQKGSKYDEFAESMVASLRIVYGKASLLFCEAYELTDTRTDKKGNLVIEASEDEQFGATIEGVRIRQSAQYHNKSYGGSRLTVNVYRIVQKSLSFQAMKTAFRGMCDLSAAEYGSESPSQWVEASILSVRGEELFAQNVGLRFGDCADWDCEQLEAAGVFEDISRPALGMITGMDDIGSANNNGQGLQIQNTHCTTLPQQKDDPNKYVFW